MVDVHLFDNVVGPPTIGGGAVTQTLGVAFVSAQGLYVTGLRWYATDTNTAHKPSALYLWDQPSASAVVTVPGASVVHSGSVGWQTITLGTPYQLTAGRTYYVTMDVIVGQTSGSVTNPAQPPYPLSFLSPPGRNSNGGQPGLFPVNSNNSAFWVDVIVSADFASSPDPAPTLVGDLKAALASWLINTGDNTHQSDGLPWNTQVAVDLANNNLTALADSQALIRAVTDELGPYLPGWATTLLGLDGWLAAWDVDQWSRLSDRILGASGGGGSAFYGPGGQQVSAGVEALLVRSTNAMAGFPSAPWELIDETDWNDALAWDVPADLYVLTFTTLPDLPENGRAGVPTRYRLAWWSPLNGEFARERRWIDFPSCHLIDAAGRMPGLLLQTYDLSGAGHVQAWQLNP